MGRRMYAATASFSVLLMLPSMSLGLDLPKEHSTSALEVAALFEGPMPSGVTVSDNGRIFVSFPRWGDAVQYTVAEVKDGKTLPYPTASINDEVSGDAQADHLVSVQSVVVDPSGHTLWILDTGSIAFGPVKAGGPKLLSIDLNTDQVIKKIAFPPDVALPTSYLNDVRFDLRRGKAGMAFITDSTFTRFFSAPQAPPFRAGIGACC